MNETKCLCPSCISKIFCPTWGEVKCTAKKHRIYGWKEMTECKEYKKRPDKWKEPRCQCKDCLENDKLSEEREEK